MTEESILKLEAIRHTCRLERFQLFVLSSGANWLSVKEHAHGASWLVKGKVLLTPSANLVMLNRQLSEDSSPKLFVDAYELLARQYF
jgi:hypothetical protein